MEHARYGREVKTLDHAFREFRGNRSPWIIGAAIVAAAAARIAVGGFSWRDVVAAAAMLVIYPFGEWAIHVYLLHMPPFELRGKSYYLPTSKAHWAHQKQPTDLGMILLEPREVVALLGLAVPVSVALSGLLVWPIPGGEPWGALVTELLVGYVLVGVYEWTHFLIHTAYRPRSRYYRNVWRTHRLHHFKNEHFWHGITNTVADRALGTNPDQREVERSRTARNLDISRV
jgi:sterol desaturase/sphingolipid hydroxylase (fatty acid hydroxylase superfamily)